ncbi:unnamed protein product [Nezara viridula]|uniref:Neuropeptide n=1 Tax=Nezara viridula TaxID=85310 RepID=A0A9P0HHN9_NEZVI|nr:unnamed protein product [Nezara viridula]CAH1402226.1 unnamed protein product [Nezara viridula]
MASYKTLFVLFVALFAVAFAAEEARGKRGVFYGGYGAYPYSSYGYHGLGYSGLGYSGLGYGYGLGYHSAGYSGLGYHGLGYSYLH